VQIAHNVHIGSLTVVAGNTAIAGSTRIGKMCMIGGSSSFSGHLTIADRTTISGGTTIIRSIDQPGQHYTSIFPMLPHADWEKNAAILRSLDKMRARVKELEKQLKLIK
jgi:UDP-3-O-[3-hydroxymyristoyl] glucosamine N-acyltransferase